MKIFDKFRKLEIDCSLLGLEQSENFVEYYCTPKNAKIFAASGIDGIHYCTVRQFGEIIFAVSPMNFGDCVHPIARNFEDLLRLLLHCGDIAALEQCYAWDEEQYKAFLIDCPVTEEQQAVLDEIKNKYGLEPIENSFAYVKKLQAEFDLSQIPYNEDYYDPEMNAAAPEAPIEWAVYYDGGFWTKHSRSRAGTEILINKYFQWGSQTLYVPAVYSCSKGIVVDICVKVEALQLQSYFDKWMPLLQCEDRMSAAQREQAERENPLDSDFVAKLEVNGNELVQQHGCAISWLPEAFIPEEIAIDNENKLILEHYGMDADCGWSVHRLSFAWKTKHKPNVKSINLKLEQRPVSIEGPHLKNPKIGDTVDVIHPLTGEKHILTVREYEKNTLDFKRTELSDYDFPKHHTVMTYTLTPDLPDGKFRVCDCLRNDSPVYVGAQSPDGSSAIGIIGGADGPTAVMLSASGKNESHIACSALHFEPTDNVEWKTVFREKLCADIQVDLM
ncbi:MAG: hypothetical protein IJZ35_05585 [Clostridia bacterium]|nr:hypothetical protein [Clostridia bacterium]